MKKLLNILTIAAAATAMVACTTDLDDVKVDPSNVVLPTIAVPSTVDLGSQAATVEFDYTPIDYGFSAAVKYTLHVEMTDTQKQLALDVKTADGKFQIDRFAMNNALIGAGAAPAAASNARMWVEAGMVNDKNVVIASTVYESEKVDTKFVPYVWSVKGILTANGAETIVDMKETAADQWLAEKTPVYGAFKFVYNHKDAGALGGTFAELKKDFDVSTSGAAIEIAESDDFKLGDMLNIRLNTSTNVASVSVPDICWSLIGVNGDWNKDVDMIEVLDGVWMSPVTEMEGNFKLRYAAGWDINRGGAMTEPGRLFEVAHNGDNIELPKKAKYQVVYYEELDKIAVTEVRAEDGWSVIGGTVMNNTDWTADFYMTQAADGKWFVDNLFVDGSCKLRFACDWDAGNRGGKFGDLDVAFTVEPDGDNINLYKNFYNIVYDPAAETITVSAGESYIDGGREYPTEIQLTGDFSGYNWVIADAPAYAMDKYSGIATGYVSMCGMQYGFKVTHAENQWVPGGNATTDGNDTTFELYTGDNMMLADGGYFFTVNFAEQKAVFHKFDKVGIIGDATEGGWNDDTLLTLDPATGLFSTTTTFKDGVFKVRFDGGWDNNLGGSLDNMVHNGSDIAVEAGTYEVVLDMTKQPITVTLNKK